MWDATLHASLIWSRLGVDKAAPIDRQLTGRTTERLLNAVPDPLGARHSPAAHAQLVVRRLTGQVVDLSVHDSRIRPLRWEPG